MLSKSTSAPRRTHRKRVSALHLSTDTTTTLPEYCQASGTGYSWPRHHQDTSFEDEVPSDKPPDYPDSAEEADEDTDSERQRDTFYVHQLPTSTSILPRTPYTSASTTSTTSPRRKQRYYQHKRKHSAPIPALSATNSVDPYLDSLLERSVHALEMSNTLLQTSVATQTSLSNVLTCDSPADASLEVRAMSLSARIKGNWDNQPSWVDDLDEITKGVDSLFGNAVSLNEERAEGNAQDASSGLNIRSKEDWSRHLRSPSGSEAGLSSSLPAAASPLEREPRSTRKRPSLDLRQAVTAAETSRAARLRLAHRTREDLIAPPPRALTQYIETDTDPFIVALPSTLGIRANNSVYPNAEWNASTSSLHSSPALPIVTDEPLSSSSTPAYAKLASFVIKRPSSSANATPSSSFTASPAAKRRNSSTGSSERDRCRSSPQSSPRPRSRTLANHESPLSHQCRPMTPPDEESSSSSEGCVAKQTISSLRKILDEQQETKTSLKKAHIFMPVTPAPAPVSGTSTATASISRMLTKKLHHSSTQLPSPPRSAMKGSRPTTPSPSSPFPPSSAISDTLTIPKRIAATVHSASSSGRSTPKRISFAELPEAHVSSRPEKFRDKGRRKGKGKSSIKGTKLRGGADGDGSEEDGLGGWFSAWFGLNPPMGATGLSYATRQDERMEDRINRNWAGRFGGGGGGAGHGYLDEWGV